MSNEFDLIMKKYIDKFGRSMIAGPVEIFKFLSEKNKKEYKKEVDYDKYFSKKENELEYNLFNFLLQSELSKEFLENENSKSLKKILVGPFLADINKVKKLVTLYLNDKKKLEVSDTAIFAFYNLTDKIFMWTQPDDIKQICTGGIFRNFTFCNANIIKNINLNEANALAVWYRTYIFYERNVLKIKSYKEFKTTNLIKFEIEIEGKVYLIYTLIDFGIKDPKLDKNMKKTLDQFESFPFMIESLKATNKKKNLMKGIKFDSLKVSNKQSFKKLKRTNK